jgi:glycosyltransferase involved in cell wall biosynthesis
MKILYFTRGQSPHDLRFMQALSTSGHSAAVLCMEDVDPSKWPQGIVSLAWPKPPQKFSWLSAPALAKAFRQIAAEYQPDVIHAGPIQSTAYIAALSGCGPLLSMSWGSDLLMDAERGLIWRRVTEYTLTHTSLLAADCHTVVDAAVKYGYTGQSRIFPWGVDLDHFKPGGVGDLRQKLDWQDKVVFLSNRTMEKLYGVDVVARAFAGAALKNPDLRLLLFGKGAQELAVYKILQDAKVTDRVFFGGFAGLEQLPDIYHSSDYYVSASHSDGSSVSLMETLACGKPVLLSDIPSNREWIESGVQGWYFDDGSVEALETAMLAAAGREHLKEMSASARKLAEARADWKKNFAVLLAAYAEAAASGKKVI